MVEHREGEPLDVLLVEDNPGDVRLTEEAFRGGSINNDLTVVTDGEKALDFLYQREEYADATCPDIILLDLDLPKIDGRAVLEEIKADPDLERLPIVVLTSSEAQQDVVESYELQASAYLTKPVSAEDFVGLVQSFEEFWCTMVRLPPKTEGRLRP